MRKKSLIILVAVILFIAVIICVYSVTGSKVEADPKESSISVEDKNYSGEYRAFLSANQDKPYISKTSEIQADMFGLDLLSSSEKYNYSKPAVLFESGEITVHITSDKECLSLIYLDCCSLADSLSSLEISVEINGEYQYEEASQIIIDTFFTDSENEPTQDRYGNDISIIQTTYRTFQNNPLRSGSRLYFGGNAFLLKAGVNEINIHLISGTMILGSIYFQGKEILPSYEDYLNEHEEYPSNQFIEIEAEKSLYKNSPSLIASSTNDSSATPYDIKRKKVNVVGLSNYNNAGDKMTWEVKTDHAGYYNLMFKVNQSNRYNTSYRTLFLNGKIPFEEAKHLTFSYKEKWQNTAISSFNNEKFKVYLEAGINTISLEVDSTLFTIISEEIERITSEMNTLGLNVKKITGNNTDKGIDWDIRSFFPDIMETLDGWTEDITSLKEYLISISGFNKTSYAVRDFNTVITYISRIKKDVDELPRKLTLLSEGDNCSAQVLASWIDAITLQPMEIDKIYVYSDNCSSLISKPNINGFKKAWIGFQKFILSFFDRQITDEAEDDELEVWVNRSRIYVDQLQTLVDSSFTKETGIKVKVSLMSDEGKLVLSNAADEQPDVALGVSAWIPNEYGMRGAIYDLTQEKDLSSVLSYYLDEELIPGIYDGHLYSLPETENFYVLFYRKDILSSLSLSIPDTWDDVVEMLPTLTRYGMSFYIPLSSNASTKSFDSTSMFIYQFNGSIYSSDSMHGGLDTTGSIEAMTFMTDLYREYGLTYNVSSFFNEFRYGTIPIGIADFGTYITLKNGAPELSGLYNIQVIPGIKDDNGVVQRYASGAQQSMMIFEKSEKKKEAWTFLKWWARTDTQVTYSNLLVNSYGKEYLWNTANIDAFSKIAWPVADKKVILEQWKYLKEVPKVPGAYIIEREISNVWNAVVFDDANLRSEISDASIRIDREMKRKLTQFGYYDGEGNKLRDVNLATASLVSKWRKNG